jgi:molecular chaperone DnaK
MPAPRGIPQVEVTLDIDANGILSVSAKDEGTGKEQKITVTGSSSLDKSDIDRMVKEAATYAEEDKQQREKIEKRNSADSLIYNVEKTISDMGDKITEEEKDEVKQKIETLRGLLNSTEDEDFDKAFQDLQESAFAMSQKLYEQSQPTEAETTDEVVDAEVVNEA